LTHQRIAERARTIWEAKGRPVGRDEENWREAEAELKAESQASRSSPASSLGLHEEDDGRILVVLASGKLSRDDYEHFVPEMERLISRHGKINILFEMRDFHGWEAGALWEDTKFALHHFHDIGRLAVVGEARWEEAMTIFCKPFTKAEIRYFEHRQHDEALRWLRSKIVNV